MFERLWGRGASGACDVEVFGPPRRVGGQVAFSCPHLVYSAGNKPVEPHEGVGGELPWVRVAIRSGVKSFPVV